MVPPIRSGQGCIMIPISDSIPARRFPYVNTVIVAASFVGWWFLFQFIDANFGPLSAQANGDGVALFAHVGGFAFGLVIAAVASTSPRTESLSATGARPY